MGLNGFVDWSDVQKEKNQKSGFLKMKSGNEYKIRPVHRMFCFYKYFYRNNGVLRTAITADPDNCPVRKAHPEAKLKAVERYAFYLIDREDGQLKIAEVPKSVITPMSDKARHAKKQCGQSKGAWDWIIEISGSGLNTEYKVICDDMSDLTEAELGEYKKAVGGDLEKLAKLYAAHTPEEIEKKLFGPLEVKDNKKQQQPQTTGSPVAKKASAHAAEEEFAFGDESQSEEPQSEEKDSWTANF